MVSIDPLGANVYEFFHDQIKEGLDIKAYNSCNSGAS